jgi:hypothetical protein
MPGAAGVVGVAVFGVAVEPLLSCGVGLVPVTGGDAPAGWDRSLCAVAMPPAATAATAITAAIVFKFRLFMLTLLSRVFRATAQAAGLQQVPPGWAARCVPVHAACETQDGRDAVGAVRQHDAAQADWRASMSVLSCRHHYGKVVGR